MLITQDKTNWKFLLIVVILAAVVGGGIWIYFGDVVRNIISLSQFPEIKKPIKIAEDEIANWKTYNSGQEIMGLSLKTPSGWAVKFKEEPPFSNEINGIWFDFAPPGFVVGSVNAWNWMGWGALSIGIGDAQPDINKWIEQNLPEYKEELVIEQRIGFGGKPAFLVDKKEGFWVPRHVILGDRYSYVYGFSQDGETNFVEILIKEIFPNITIK